MRQLAIVGIVVLGLGTSALFRGGRQVTPDAGAHLARSNALAGDFRMISPWLIAAAIGSGLVLFAVSARPKT
jgi:hypothetical protein